MGRDRPFPARAGMNLDGRAKSRNRVTVPRTRADEPVILEQSWDGIARSPHARG